MSKNKKKFIEISESKYQKLLAKEKKLEAENAVLKHRICEFELTIKDLQRTLFASTSEKTPKSETVDYNQLSLFEDNNPDSTVDIENETPALKPVKEKILKKRKKRGRKVIGANLPEIEEIIKLEDEKKFDKFGNPLSFIGYHCSRKVHIIPAQIFCKVIKREIWGYGDSRERIEIAGMPDFIVPKGKYTNETICHFIYEKYFNSLPYHRLINSLNAAGEEFSKSTVSDATCWFANLFDPVAKAIKNQIFPRIFGVK